MLISLGGAPDALAQIVSDPSAPRSQLPTVLRTANGLPQVDIRTPSVAGVSRNSYRQFDVLPVGAVLNNSRTNTTTQLAGWIQGNPWVAGGPARVILNEVNSSDPSRLRGPVEVAGQRADVVIANPAGIVINGAGFINASRVTLTTGTPVFGLGGSLDAYSVRQGLVEVQGAGLDSRSADYTAILARAVQVQGGVWAGDLRVVTGANQVSADGAQASPQPGLGAAPARAIDVAQLGGMYAGRIFLIATEAGVGVSNSGSVTASVGRLQMDTAGNLSNTGAMYAAAGMGLGAASLENRAVIVTQGALDIRVSGLAVNSGLLGAQEDLRLAAGSVENRGDVLAGLTGEGGIGPTGRLAISARETLTASGRQGAGASVDLAAAALDLSGSQTEAKDVTLNAGTALLILQGAQIRAAERLEGSAAAAIRTDKSEIEAGSIHLTGATLTNAEGRLHAHHELRIDAGHIGNKGSLSAGQLLTLHGGLVNDGAVGSGRALSVAGAVTNTGQMNAERALAIAGSLENSGTVQAGGDLLISGPTENRGTLVADGNLTLGSSVINRSILAAGQDLLMEGGLSNSRLVQAGQDLNLVGPLTNGGQVIAGRDLWVTGALANTGLVQGTRALSVDTRGAGFHNEGAQGLMIGGSVTLRVKNLDNTGGRIAAVGPTGPYPKAHWPDNEAGAAVSGLVDLTIEATEDVKNSGALNAAQGLRVSAGTRLINSGSIVGSSLALSSGQLVANRGTSALIGATDPGGLLSITAPSIENSDDATATDTDPSTTILGLGDMVLAGGRSAQGDLLPARQIVNRSGLIEAGGYLLLRSGEVLNTRRQLVVSPDFNIVPSQTELAAAGVSLSGQVGETNVRNPDLIGGIYIEQPHEGWMNSDYRYTRYEGTATQNSVIAISPRARMAAGGGLDATGVNVLRNYWSDVSAGGAISLGAAHVDQDSWRGALQPLIRVTYTGQYHYTNYKGVPWTRDFLAPDVREYRQLPGYESTLTSGTAITGAGGTLINGSRGATRLPLGSARGHDPAVAPIGSVASPGGLPESGSASRGVGMVSSSPSPKIVIAPSTLYRIAPDPAATYLVETDPRFTQQRQWLSSSYLLDALGIQPALIDKRLGDGFYEQRMVREQLTQLTGRRFLTGFTDEEDQYRTLLVSAATQAHALQLSPGVALGAEQVAQLTSDLVWLVREEVQMPDGRRAYALVPRVYLSPGSAALQQDGALVAAPSIDLRGMEELRNSGTLAASGDLQLDAIQDLDNRMGQLLAGGVLSLSAQRDVDLTGAVLKAGTLRTQAGRDIVIAAETRTEAHIKSGNTGTRTAVVRAAEVAVEGDAVLIAGRNLALRGAVVTIGGNLAADVGGNLVVESAQTSEEKSIQGSMAGGTGQVSSQSVRHVASTLHVGGSTVARVAGDMTVTGSDLTLGTTEATQALIDVKGQITVAASKDSLRVDSHHRLASAQGTHRLTDETIRSASLTSGGSLTLRSGGDITVAGARVETTGTTQLVAGGSIRANSVAESHTYEGQSTGSHTAGLGQRSLSSSERRGESIERGASIAGGAVILDAREDVRIAGSAVLAETDLAVNAGRDVRVEATTNTERSASTREEKRTGVFSSGNGVGVGKRVEAIDQVIESNTAQDSTVGSVKGNVSIRARASYRQEGSHLVASQGDLTVAASRVDIVEARETTRVESRQHTRQGGVTVGVSSPIISSVQSAQRSLNAAGKTPNERSKSLAHASAGIQLYGAVADATDTNFKPDPKRVKDSLSLNVSLGTSRSDSVQAQVADMAHRSSIKAGGRVSFVATGEGKDSTIRLQGVDFASGGDTVFSAEGDIAFLAVRNTMTERSQSASSSASIGVSISALNGISGNMAASRSRGTGDEEDARWDNARVAVGGRLSITSGGRVDARGAVLQGEHVAARVAGDLLVESLQDTGRFNSQSSNAGFSFSVPLRPPGAGVPGAPGASGAGSGAGSTGWRVGAGRSSAGSNHASVGEQSGLFGGTGGFDIEVGGKTGLVGGVVVSAADQSANRLVTATLTQRDIVNGSSANASTEGFSLSSEMFTQGRYGATKGIVGNLADKSTADGRSQGITRSAVSEGGVVITDGAGQQALTGQSDTEAVAALSRDVAHTQQAAPRIDGKALQQQVQAEQAIRNEAVAAFTRFSDPAWRVMFKEKPSFYRVTCPPGADCTRQPELAKTELITGTPEQIREEIAKAPAGTVLAVNGIQNDLERAGQLAMQNARPDENQRKPESIILMHYVPTGNVISEMLVAGYEKGLAPILGHTNQSIAYADALQVRGQQATESDGHSRGTIVQVNAFSILEGRGFSSPALAVRGVGGAVPANRFVAAAHGVMAPDRDRRVEFAYFTNDPVAVIAGGNPGVVSLEELWRVITTSNSAHSCYGTGAPGCRQVQYLSTKGPIGATQDNSRLRVINGTERPSEAPAAQRGKK